MTRAKPSKKQGHSISFYFVLYTIAIITVFVTVMERDALLHQRDVDMANLVQIYIKPLVMSSYVDTAQFFIPAGAPVTPDSLYIKAKSEGPIDRGDIKYSLVDAYHVRSDGDRESIAPATSIRNDQGDGVLVVPPIQEGTYAFRVAGYKRRIISDGRTMKVQIKDTTYSIGYSEILESVDRDTVELLAKVTRSGMVPPQLVVNVQEPRDNWVLGVPYRKKIFVGGVENMNGVAFNVTSPGRLERDPGGGSFVTLVWDRPTLGSQSFSISADSRRGFGSKDRASVSFQVDVRTPTFVLNPAEKGFWGIPYVFDGQVVGLNPLDLSVQATHDGQTIHTKPVVPRDTIVPDRSWSALIFKVLYRDAVIREHRVALFAPPPPQIKWVQQTIDRARNVFLITMTSADPVGGPVRVSLQTQPSGIATIDKIRGTSFTISVNLESKPSAIYIKLTATDQYGGQSVSSRQFNVPQ
jgi:hypothetical protein